VAAAFDGVRYLLAYVSGALYAVRINPADLSLLDATPLTVYGGDSGYSAQALAAAADRAPSPEQRTFLVGYTRTGLDGVVSRRIRAASGLMVSPVTVSGTVPDVMLMDLASDGTDFLLVWGDSIDAVTVRAARIEALGGIQLGGTVNVFPALVTDSSWTPRPRVTYVDGAYLVVTSAGSYLAGRRLGTDLAPVDASQFTIDRTDARLSTEESGPSIASNRNGRSLVLYPGSAPEWFTVAVKGKFIDPVPCGGAGGSGGMNSGGAGGKGAGGSTGGTVTALGGTGPAGGSSAQGGNVTGGTSVVSGGTSGLGGSDAGGQGTPGTETCNCALAGGASATGPAAWTLALLWMLTRRRSRRSSAARVIAAQA
jgi:MYXO-CTERM domain-containing protein